MTINKVQSYFAFNIYLPLAYVIYKDDAICVHEQKSNNTKLSR